MNLRKQIKDSDKPLFKVIRILYRIIFNFSIPAPRSIWYPIWQLVNFVRNLYYWAISVFWITPIYKGLSKKIGENFTAETFLPYVIGKGHIFAGDNVSIHGKVDFIFGSIKRETPEIHIGDNTGIGHNVMFDIAGKLVIGNNCLIASDVSFQDCSGHSIDAEKRIKKIPPDEKEVKPITIGNNVWIGTGAYIFPGTKIGDNCVISAMTPVGRKIPPNHLVYATPSKIVKIRSISKML
ncbi:MAG: hypothetical protein B6I30_03615 [Desulfobacteraceae bacterium 4572_187]|nr:MAG: hypothetical protein B6I30_03615 [Desulfobacteraceae bacterium 4572_187]